MFSANSASSNENHIFHANILSKCNFFSLIGEISMSEINITIKNNNAIAWSYRTLRLIIMQPHAVMNWQFLSTFSMFMVILLMKFSFLQIYIYWFHQRSPALQAIVAVSEFSSTVEFIRIVTKNKFFFSI